MMNKSKIKDRAVRGVRRKPVSFVLTAACFLLGCCVSAQETEASNANSQTGLVKQTRLWYKDKEKQIDDLVREGVQFELKKEYQPAIDKYNEAKTIADSPELAAIETFKSRSDKCASKIANAYFYWAQAIYDEA